jgi:hypothetical protein
MNARKLLTIAVVSTLLIGGMAALGAASPPAQANDNAPDGDEDRPDADAAQNGTDAGADRPGNAGAADEAAADGVGPSGGLPEQVPGHVSEIHDRIDSFKNGSIDNLGESLSELLGGDEADDEADNADGDSEDAAETGDAESADDADDAAETGDAEEDVETDDEEDDDGDDADA